MYQYEVIEINNYHILILYIIINYIIMQYICKQLMRHLHIIAAYMQKKYVTKWHQFVNYTFSYKKGSVSIYLHYVGVL